MRLILALLCLLPLAACDRPLVDPIAPEIEVVSPDLSEVQLADALRLQISAEALRGVERLSVDGAAAALNPETGLWEIELALASGADALVLEAFSDGATATDTAYVVHLSLDVAALGQVLPEARAEHSATPIPQGVLLAGGVGSDGQVLGTTRRLTENGAALSFGSAGALQFARTGHTGTALPDGRVLLLGGVSTATPEGLSSFVATPEVYDPASETTRAVAVRGLAVRRTGHSSLLLERSGRLYLYVFGGRTLGGSGGLVTSRTFDILEFRPGTVTDTLVTLTPSGGGAGPVPLADPTQIVLRSSPAEVVSILSGLEPGASRPSPPPSASSYTAPGSYYPFDVDTREAALPFTPRTASDGVRLASGLALLARRHRRLWRGARVAGSVRGHRRPLLQLPGARAARDGPPRSHCNPGAERPYPRGWWPRRQRPGPPDRRGALVLDRLLPC